MGHCIRLRRCTWHWSCSIFATENWKFSKELGFRPQSFGISPMAGVCHSHCNCPMHRDYFAFCQIAKRSCWSGAYDKDTTEQGSRPNAGKMPTLDRDAFPPAIRSLWTLNKSNMTRVKKISLIAGIPLALTVAAVTGLFYYELCISPKLAAKQFTSLWKERLNGISDPERLPAEWRDTVYLRKFNDGWILTAMHHGSCTGTGAACFNASVLRDSLGNITICPEWSPCESDIESMGLLWERTSPVATLTRFNADIRDGLSKQK